MLQRPRNTAVSSVIVTAGSSSSSSRCCTSNNIMISSPLLIQSHRFIRKQHNYRHERYHKLLKSRRMYSRQWDVPWGQMERIKTTGHELEAFDNFGRYAHDAREDPLFDVATGDLNLIEPRERYSILVGLIEQRSKVSDGRSMMAKLRLTLKCLECFFDICKVENCLLADLDETEQRNFRYAMEEVIRVVHVARKDHPDAIAGGMRAVQICSAVGVRTQDRRRLIDTLRGFIEEMDEGYNEGHLSAISDGYRNNTHLTSQQQQMKTLSSGSGDENNNNKNNAADVSPLSNGGVGHSRGDADVNTIMRRDPVGTTYLHPPMGRGIDHEAPIRMKSDDPPSDDLPARISARYKESMKNYRYIGEERYEKGQSLPLFKKEAKTRLPTNGEGD